jgi:beta-galactosidase GanA
MYVSINNGVHLIGPVNWAGNNPSPAKGMVRLWTWEAFAHGTASYLQVKYQTIDDLPTHE